jgi:hypothetical protein
MGRFGKGSSSFEPASLLGPAFAVLDYENITACALIVTIRSGKGQHAELQNCYAGLVTKTTWDQTCISVASKYFEAAAKEL